MYAHREPNVKLFNTIGQEVLIEKVYYHSLPQPEQEVQLVLSMNTTPSIVKYYWTSHPVYACIVKYNWTKGSNRERLLPNR